MNVTEINKESTVESLMESIVNADTKPKVFKVFLIASDHTTGFDASVSFRSNERGASSLAAHASSPAEALAILYDELDTKFGRCRHCNSYRKPTGEDQ